MKFDLEKIKKYIKDYDILEKACQDAGLDLPELLHDAQQGDIYAYTLLEGLGVEFDNKNCP